MGTKDDTLATELAEVQSALRMFKADKLGLVSNLAEARRFQHLDVVARVKSGALTLKEAWGHEATVLNRLGNAHITLMNAERAGLLTGAAYSLLRIELNAVAAGLDAHHHIDPRVWAREIEEAAPEPLAA